ncbi:MAG: hypothetical protein AAF968_05050 [Pseudomonadota bacterium]
MAEASSATEAETSAAAPGLTETPAPGEPAPPLPEALTVEESAEETRLAIAPDLKVSDAVEVRDALLVAIQAAVTAGRRVCVVSEAEDADGVVGVPAMQLAIAGSRHAEGLSTKTKSSARLRRRGSATARSSKAKKTASATGASKAVAS